MANKASARVVPARRRATAKSAAARLSVAVAHLRARCSTCNLRELCAPCCNLNSSELALVDRLAFGRARVRRGESLYRAGDQFTSLYAVRKGFFKSTILLEDGRRDQVTGYSMPGEVLGMDGIARERHACNTVALEDSEVCVIPFAGLQKLTREIPALQRQFQRMMSREIVREQGVLLLLGRMNADERLAVFLLNLSKRCAAQGCSPSEFGLRMSREEIGSYLSLSLETVSRTLSRFKEQGLLEVRQKFVHLLDGAGLERVIGRERD